jgi:hypothetical protein
MTGPTGTLLGSSLNCAATVVIITNQITQRIPYTEETCFIHPTAQDTNNRHIHRSNPALHFHPHLSDNNASVLGGGSGHGRHSASWYAVPLARYWV